MFASLARALFGTANDRSLKAFQRRVPEINAHEPALRALDDAALAAKTGEFRERIAKGTSLDALLPEAFAVAREAARRVLGMRHFDVQLIGGMVLHAGRIAEMRTGEGKTLVATLAVYLSALTGKGVHVVTVNDYLARRDAEEMGQIYSFLGLTTGVIVPNMADEERRAAYRADITYGTNNEFGFDYLRDNMKYRIEDMVQRPFHHAIVDEVDSILIDEARTPLIISGPADDSSDLYRSVDEVVRELVKVPETFEKDEKFRTVILTDAGSEQVETMLREAGVLAEGGLYDIHNIAVIHHVQQSLRAHTLFSRDVDYIVRGGKVIIIDEFTGRMMDGRRYSDGLHQALEAKEHVEVQQENQTLASITFQNYFRLYPKLSGMTGTAMTEADEFAEIYKLDVVEIPTNLPVSRKDGDDEVYLTAREKYEAVSNLIEEIAKTPQPVLVGTTSIEKSEYLSELLKKRGIRHNVLNARFHEMEATIVAQAGAPGAITIATNMAGRGTDIKLGGNVEMRIRQELADVEDPEEKARREAEIRAQVAEYHGIVRAAGGLYVIGTERHESRRIDNQLRGRAGRQGDPGNSRFFISLEDDLMRIFGTERMGGMLQRLGLKDGEAIVHPWINKALERAQKKVEARNFDMRKNTLKYDDVMNDQRKEVYAQRREYMGAEDLSATVQEMRAEIIHDMVRRRIPEKAFAEQWQSAELAEDVRETLGLDLPVADWAREDGVDGDVVTERLEQAATQAQAAKAANFGPSVMRYIEKQVVLTTFDSAWKEHLLALDQLRQGIGLRAYGQKDPLNEFKHEAFQLFTAMLDEMRLRVTSTMARVEVAPPVLDNPFSHAAEIHADPQVPGLTSEPGPGALFTEPAGDVAIATPIGASAIMPDDPSSWGETPRNALCPCGSGKKYKHCHGRLA
ncbi:protein translocase subunit SecA [Gluconacetobacter liquefaciens]|uniref:Protein translocase subunit SecA n=1 Tax=Gluconacetobacter liquefaciens TaxID=89584 RepID=A0A370G9A4_GLULI|nr:preprotein translocase subunit SecA [Gluconacetobacter liquefaciens]MBB2185930.1 preprotein translocase subunit SecA [Gluconacetobacter liquefaciens]RDI39746.1 preprotein translocase subunit SecA [Gluconacetobacter liquefaciens]GBQ98795.1 preprotein translocase subunit SecA [Gluconacetobacter liquefaciens NRIC 0522]GEB37655.1 protein translocase subunit SecA [Gluconacetobacter liquefaciens]